jgi:hypothetical protein
MSKLMRSLAPMPMAAAITRSDLALRPCTPMSLTNIAGSYRVAENHPTGHRDNLYRHFIRLVHHQLDDVGDCFSNCVLRFHGLSLAERGLGFPKVDVEYAGMTKHDLFPRDVCLLREEHVSLFYFSHNIGVLLDFMMMEAFAVDHLTHLDEVR